MEAARKAVFLLSLPSHQVCDDYLCLDSERSGSTAKPGEECILNQTVVVLNYAKYAPETLPPLPVLKTQDGLLFPHPPEFLYCTQRRAHELTEKVEESNNAAFLRR